MGLFNCGLWTYKGVWVRNYANKVRRCKNTHSTASMTDITLVQRPIHSQHLYSHIWTWISWIYHQKKVFIPRFKFKIQLIYSPHTSSISGATISNSALGLGRPANPSRSSNLFCSARRFSASERGVRRLESASVLMLSLSRRGVAAAALVPPRPGVAPPTVGYNRESGNPPSWGTKPETISYVEFHPYAAYPLGFHHY